MKSEEFSIQLLTEFIWILGNWSIKFGVEQRRVCGGGMVKKKKWNFDIKFTLENQNYAELMSFIRWDRFYVNKEKLTKFPILDLKQIKLNSYCDMRRIKFYKYTITCYEKHSAIIDCKLHTRVNLFIMYYRGQSKT